MNHRRDRSPGAVLVIGQQKAGTTMVHQMCTTLLGLDEGATPLPPKELHLFEGAPCRHPDDDIARCRAETRRVACRGWFVDATPDYFSTRSAMLAIHAALPHARLVLLLRDPVERALAAWHQNARAGALVEPRAASAAMLDELEDLLQRCGGAATALAQQLARRSWVDASNPCAHPRWRKHWLRPLPDGCGSCRQYVVRGFTHQKLREWHARFGQQLLVVPFVRATQDALSLVHSLRRHLRMPTSRAPESRLRSAAALNATVHWHESSGNRTANATLDPEVRARLAGLYRDDWRRTQAWVRERKKSNCALLAESARKC